MDVKLVALDMISTNIKETDISLKDYNYPLRDFKNVMSFRKYMYLNKLYNYIDLIDEGDSFYSLRFRGNSKSLEDFEEHLSCVLSGAVLVNIPRYKPPHSLTVELMDIQYFGYHTIRDSILAKEILSEVAFDKYSKSVLFNREKIFEDNYLNIYARGYLGYNELMLLSHAHKIQIERCDNISYDIKILFNTIRRLYIYSERNNKDNKKFLSDLLESLKSEERKYKDLKRSFDKYRIESEKKLSKMYSKKQLDSLLEEKTNIISELKRRLSKKEVIEKEVVREVEIIVDNTVNISPNNFTDDFSLLSKKCLVICSEKTINNLESLNSVFIEYTVGDIDNPKKISSMIKTESYNYILSEISHNQHSIQYLIESNIKQGTRYIPVKGINAKRWIPQIYKSLYS